MVGPYDVTRNDDCDSKLEKGDCSQEQKKTQYVGQYGVGLC